MAKIKVSKQQVIDAIRDTHGMKTGVCESLGISRPTLDRYLKDADIQEALDFAKVRIKDRAEYHLAKAVERGESWALQFVLKNAKDREYSERVDVTSGGEKIVEKVDDERFDRAFSTLLDALREGIPSKSSGADGKVDTAK